MTGELTNAIRSLHANKRAIVHLDLVEPPTLAVDEDGEAAMNLMAAEMSRALEADGIQIVWHDGAHPRILYADGACEAESVEGYLLQQRVAASLHDGVQGRAPEGRWLTVGDDCAGMTTSFAAQGGHVTITAFFRRIGDTTRAKARESAARLLPLLKPFFHVWALRRRAMARLRGLTAAVNKCDVGILLLDERGQVTFANEAAEALLDESDGLRLNGTMLSGGKLADTLRLQAAIEHVLEGAMQADQSVSPVVALNRRDRRPLLTAVTAGDGEGECAAIVYLFDPEQNLSPLLEPVCKLYGLSPVETKLTCHLAEGSSLAVAAERIRVREQTARSYLKQIFLKTDTNRQAELVWLMLKSTVRTAPTCRASFV